MTESTYAASPFDHAKADIILRTSDNIDFRVFKLFLSLASPFFESLFNIPQPTEDKKTLDALLRFCYPCTLAEDPNLEQLKDVTDVLEAAKKYSINAIERKAGQALSNPKILEVEPLRCFAIAHHGQLRDETLLAAKYTLRQPLIPSWFEEIELLSAADLLALLTYHRKCGDAVCVLKTDMSWIKTHYQEASPWLSGCSSCTYPKSSTRPSGVFGSGNQRLQWWDEFMEKTFLVLRDKPCEATIQTCTEQTVQSVRARNCSCSPRVAESMREFSALFARTVEEVVSQVQLELKF
ncbi:hypothetical protein BU15DRAFT_80070 [Melanogaster broomeanus]|nr:hypothetical protein BU15DRAFT_80070 [Melanogaster broomeanus]